MGDINWSPVWEELRKQAEEVKRGKPSEEIDAILTYIDSNINPKRSD